jgi:hypothetical protein
VRLGKGAATGSTYVESPSSFCGAQPWNFSACLHANLNGTPAGSESEPSAAQAGGLVFIHGVQTRASVSLGIFETVDVLGSAFLLAARACVTTDYSSLLGVTLDLP